jgi:hypothetical protein
MIDDDATIPPSNIYIANISPSSMNQQRVGFVYHEAKQIVKRAERIAEQNLPNGLQELYELDTRSSLYRRFVEDDSFWRKTVPQQLESISNYDAEANIIRSDEAKGEIKRALLAEISENSRSRSPVRIAWQECRQAVRYYIEEVMAKANHQDTDSIVLEGEFVEPLTKNPKLLLPESSTKS